METASLDGPPWSPSLLGAAQGRHDVAMGNFDEPSHLPYPTPRKPKNVKTKFLERGKDSSAAEKNQSAPEQYDDTLCYDDEMFEEFYGTAEVHFGGGGIGGTSGEDFYDAGGSHHHNYPMSIPIPSHLYGSAPGDGEEEDEAIDQFYYPSPHSSFDPTMTSRGNPRSRDLSMASQYRYAQSVLPQYKSSSSSRSRSVVGASRNFPYMGLHSFAQIDHEQGSPVVKRDNQNKKEKLKSSFQEANILEPASTLLEDGNTCINFTADDDCPETCILDDDVDDEYDTNVSPTNHSQLKMTSSKLKSESSVVVDSTADYDISRMVLSPVLERLEKPSVENPSMSTFPETDYGVGASYDVGSHSAFPIGSGGYPVIDDSVREVEVDPLSVVYDDFEPEIEAICAKPDLDDLDDPLTLAPTLGFETEPSNMTHPSTGMIAVDFASAPHHSSEHMLNEFAFSSYSFHPSTSEQVCKCSLLFYYAFVSYIFLHIVIDYYSFGQKPKQK